jgi:tetratricopeptide (TPR) repeat protein
VLSAAELHRRGLEHTNAGRNRQALRLFTQALERGPDHELAARILLSLAYVQFELGSTDQALDLCGQALRIKGMSDQVRGLINSQLGIIHTNAGNGDEALAAFDRALDLLDESPEPQATAFLNRGNVHMQRGDIDLALDDLADAKRISADAGLDVLRAKVEHNYGYAWMLAGDLTEALRQMESARVVLEDLSPFFRAMCNQDRAEVLVAAGMVTDAEDALREAAQAYGSRGLRQRQGEAELALSRLMLRQDVRQAGRIARQAARRFRRRGSDTWALRADLVAMSSAIWSGPSERVDPGVDADALARELSDHGLVREAKLASLQGAQAELRRGEVDAAARRMKAVHVSDSEPLSTRLLDHETRARLAELRGRRADAMRQVRTGLAALHDWQSSFGSLDLQSSLVGHGRGLALQGLSLAVDDGRPDVVFEWAERARALASRVSPVRPPADERAAADLADLRQLQMEITAAESAGHVSKTLLAHANRLRSKIRQRAWYGEGSGVVTEPAALDEAVAVLADTDGALLSYLVVRGSVYALVVGADHPALVDLGPYARVRSVLDGLQADLDMAAASRLSGPLAKAVREGLRGRVGLLADALVTPLRDRLGDRRIVVVPAGSLAAVPWSLLPGLARTPVTVPRSATAWLRARGRNADSSRAGFVAGPRVARAHEEVARASAPWADAVALSGDEADASAVRTLAASVDVFHVAAHGRHSADNPLFSGLELADGPWFGYDIDQLEHIPSTVVLSACEVGRSSVRWGEETIGMTVAWLHAGARCVIASPALVNDDTACEVLAATHAALARGANPSDALAAAAGSVAVDASPAPFLCFGSGW